MTGQQTAFSTGFKGNDLKDKINVLEKASVFIQLILVIGKLGVSNKFTMKSKQVTKHKTQKKQFQNL
jgi:uncharacterized membrane protein YsdA (DUF1294 family)